MRLVIERGFQRDQLGSVIGYQSRCYIKDEGPPYVDPPPQLAAQRLEELAEWWLTLFAPDQEADTNKVLFGEHDGWSELTLKIFLSNGFSVSSKDVVAILAAEERIKRACELAAFMLAHHKAFGTNARQLVEINPPTSLLDRVSAIAFPPNDGNKDTR